MKLYFYSISSNGNVSYISDFKFNNNEYSFIDKSLENTNIKISIINDNNIKLLRYGDTNMDMDFILGEKTKAYYNNTLGLSFYFYVYTKNILIENNKIKIEYDFYLDDEYNDTYKIYLLIK